MMDWTDRHDRFFLRLISRHVRLYTEMVSTGAVLYGDRDRLLGFDPSERPLALQLGGSDARELAECARIGEDWGYDEINLNCGCPSDRVQNRQFGACLMGMPETVARGVEAMRAATSLPVTVKCRIGIDDRDSWDEFLAFVDTVAEAGCDTFIVHARKAWLQGLSPKQNREIPSLRHEWVHRLKAERPHLSISINGGITSLDEAAAHLASVDGVMIGRAAYQNPWLLADADARIFDDEPSGLSRHEIVDRLIAYIERELATGTRLAQITRHILGLFQGRPGARGWRRHLAENAHRPGAGAEVVLEAAARVPREQPSAEAA